MFAANTYRIRLATIADAETLNRLARHYGLRPLQAPVLVGERRGTIAAALSLSDDRVIADDATATDHLIANLRTRAISIRAQERTPSLPERMMAGLPAWYRATALPTTADPNPPADRELAAARS